MTNRPKRGKALLARARTKISRLKEAYYQKSKPRIIANLAKWLGDPAIDSLSPHAKEGIENAIQGALADGQWDRLATAFARESNFGTGGIRNLMAFDKASILRLKAEGIDAPILKGPNTFNNIVVLTGAVGIARYFKKRAAAASVKPPRPKKRRAPAATKPVRAIVGFDSRIQGAVFARIIAEVFLAEKLEVYLFDEAVPYPEVTFAIPHYEAAFGVFISASHNDFRYNGFKLSGPNGAQIPSGERDHLLKAIRSIKPKAVRHVPFGECSAEELKRLTFLGGDSPRRPTKAEIADGFSYHGRGVLDIHREHVKQVKSFLLRSVAELGVGDSLRIVYAAFNGSGRVAVPRILGELGFRKVHRISSLDELDGMFPKFKDAPGEEQQPDPGDPRAAVIALREFDADARKSPPPRWGAGDDVPVRWENADILLGTDPDADRCGVVVRPPDEIARAMAQHPTLRYAPDHVLLPADDLWSLVLWYRLQWEAEHPDHSKTNPAARFIALSHTTSDVLVRIAEKYGLGVLKTWVGFGVLSEGVSAAWLGKGLPLVREGRQKGKSAKCHRVFFDTARMKRRHVVNVATMEQSNGFSILGRKPKGYPRVDRSLGEGGHVRDKDGTFAALLVTEIAAYAKAHGTDLLTLLAERIFSDPDIGLFANYYEPDPLDGEYPGLKGDAKKKGILEKAMALADAAEGGGLSFAGRRVTRSRVYWTGKYDAQNYKHFPDEGIRLFLGSDLDYITIRPSGTTNSLRFHVQLFGGAVPAKSAWQRRLELEAESKKIVDELRERLDARRAEGAEY